MYSKWRVAAITQDRAGAPYKVVRLTHESEHGYTLGYLTAAQALEVGQELLAAARRLERQLAEKQEPEKETTV